DRGQLHEVVELAAGAAAPVRVNQNNRFRHWVKAVREHLPSIGPLDEVRIRFAQPEFADGERASLAHPLLSDMAIHHVDLLRFIAGEGAAVLAANAARTEDCVFGGLASVDAVLELDGGARVSYGATWAARGGETP